MARETLESRGGSALPDRKRRVARFDVLEKTVLQTALQSAAAGTREGYSIDILNQTRFFTSITD